ncbi:hypothetical protein PISMIDRAFT_678208 [Pisolithus microcarpus 441]|uniref:Unplaced genomic scaffold scaffold_31, whole genome shotgun sequence n=1 Tax=Pisolithus microcarpus 441 TaxID=765257 RepID=A0A0C9YHV2_9AGAM|nr:hypothetical protein PISMIDRAFT_678208 [Pisolithus microcarpus 441]
MDDAQGHVSFRYTHATPRSHSQLATAHQISHRDYLPEMWAVYSLAGACSPPNTDRMGVCTPHMHESTDSDSRCDRP